MNLHNAEFIPFYYMSQALFRQAAGNLALNENTIKNTFGRLQVQIEQDLSSNYISGIHLIKKSVEQFIRSVVA